MHHMMEYHDLVSLVFTALLLPLHIFFYIACCSFYVYNKYELGLRSTDFKLSVRSRVRFGMWLIYTSLQVVRYAVHVSYKVTCRL